MLSACRAVVIALGLLSVAGASPLLAQSRSKDDLVIGMTQFPANLHPSIESMLAKSYVLGMARRPFTTYDADWKLICMLCTELPTIENGLAVPEQAPGGKKGIAVTYTIRPDAHWGDGTPITTDDVQFTYDVGRHPEGGLSNFELYRRIHKITIKDKKTFTLHVDKLTFEYGAINDFQPLPAHIERAAFAEPKDYRTRTRYDTDSTNPGLYFGPYRVTEVAHGSHILLEPNPRWWGKKPAFRRIVVKTIENTAALEANLLSGSIDYIAGELGLTLDQALAFEKKHGSRYDVQYKPGLVYEHIDMNLDNPVLADKRVRHALILSLDRQAISDRLFEGRQPVAHGQTNPLDWVYDKELPQYPYDPKRAAALLAEAGWTEMKGGFRHNKQGERLSLELMTTAGNRNRELVQQVLQSQWKQVGIDVRLRNEPPRVFFGETVSKRKYSALAMFAWVSSPENVPRTTLHSEQIPSPTNNWGGQNYTGFKNKEMDELIDAIEIELDREKRRLLWQRLQRLYAEELPVLPLYFRADPFVVPKWLIGIRPTGHQYITTLWVEEWARAE
ncbi:MAG: peptide ABC transporter substrate-binding protein [Alphaproteobacteria bacterium]|nr:peptide ABC transporter substrate-binding protein [Alphaproteobacteria bacterium]